MDASPSTSSPIAGTSWSDVSTAGESSSGRAMREASRPPEAWRRAFKKIFVERRDDDASARAFAPDDVLHFVSAVDHSTFVKRWKPGMTEDFESARYGGVDWAETFKLNACAASAYVVVVGQFTQKDRGDLATTVIARAFASPHRTELDERGTAVTTAGTYPLMCFTFDEPATLDARAGRMVYVTLRRVRDARSSSGAASGTMRSGKVDDGGQDSDIVFSTHAALTGETPTKLGRALIGAPPPKTSFLSMSPARMLASPVRHVVKELFGLANSPVGGGTRDVRPGVELYPAGDGKYVLRSVIAPCADVVYDIATSLDRFLLS